MPSADRSDSPDDREKDEGRGGGKKSAGSKAKDLSHVPCKFYKVGSCTAGSSCPFSHSLVEPGGQKDVCAWFVKGNCKFGHKCALAHVLPGQSMAMDRKNKKAAQIAAGGSKREGGEGRGRGGSKREGGGNATRNGLLAAGPTGSSRARPPMNMPLKATISPSAPAPALKDTDFASFGVLDEASALPTAPARNKSPDLPKPPSPTIPVSAPRRPSMSSTSPSRDFGPIGSPPSSATSPSSRVHSATPPTQNGFLSTSPFSAPGTQSVFLGARQNMGMAASLGSGVAMGGGPGGWTKGNGRGEIDISVEHEDSAPRVRKVARKESSEDFEDFLPSSLTDLLTPEERSRRMSRSNSGQDARPGLGVPLGSGGATGGHRYSRSVPAPSILGGGGDLKSIWSTDPGTTSSGLPSSPLHGSYSSQSGMAFGGREAQPSSSFVDDRGLGMRGLSPSNASAAFLPGIHHYIAQNKRPAMSSNPGSSNNLNVTSANGLNNNFSSNAALQGPPGIAHYLNSGPSGVAASGNGNGSPYVRPNPFDLTQAMHQPSAGPPGLQGAGGLGPNDTHILSPNARALQAHAPGQSLPQGLAAGYSRIHALPPLAAGSPSPAAFSPGVTQAVGITTSGFGGRDWSTMSPGSVSGSPGMGFLSSALNNSSNTTPQAGQKGLSPPAAPTPDQNTIMGRLSYSAMATKAPAQIQRNASGGAGSRWQQPTTSPRTMPARGNGDDDDQLFTLDE
ncbi:hypothetical protein FB45DRAFT_468036 [Roridomyces roridus]|uniref:C3H1-type domain-containing protein n=1 Tax=Roridomyces roridus TaxID=1738132 RepID=A0AAD7BYJ0_9AGAR|nr:hypothetical protein FB45DRAFT_468036 [Roridomyces roridus]